MPVRVAVVGAGYFARFHYDAWTRLPDAELVGLCDRDGEKAAEMAKTFSVSRHFENAETLLETLEPDLLDIVVPPEEHGFLIGLAAQYGVDAICQKPFCGSLQAAERAMKTARDSGIMLAVHENFRFQPWYREIRQQIEAGAVGDPYQVSFRLRPGDGQGPDAYLARQPYFQKMPRFLIHETGIHFIDSFRYLMGEVESVYADLKRLNPAIAGEDAGIVHFRFRSGATGLFDGNRLADHAAENRRLTMGELWLDGSEGTLRLDGDGNLFLRRHGSNEETRVTYDIPETGFGGDSVLAMQQHVISHLNAETALETDAEGYLVNLRIEEAIYASAKTGRRVDIGEISWQAP